MEVLACIPARYGSTRFTGKVLAKDTGKFLIQHTYESASLAKLPEQVLIAADDERILDAAKTFGAKCVLTSAEHKSGTDRIAEAVANIDAEIIVNLQADEPEIDPGNIDFLVNLLMVRQDFAMATLSTDFQNQQQVFDPNVVKVMADCNNRAIYFSRSVIPYDRQSGCIGSLEQYQRHIGIYAYRKDFLVKFAALAEGRLEKIEKLEQLRAIENGYPILVGKVEHYSDGIDTPEQYAEFVRRYTEQNE
ncbi:MAG: 3-deoxy-manno-octulosonate cytidylyltransferase [Sedimentisphaerales bacterium]|nr:3-deoxy-manno-octulosonate cytidylyltransferase [Sedimentisphaerales bacterium]